MSASSGACWQTDNFADAISYLTGRAILRNTDPERVLLCPEERWDPAGVRTCVLAFHTARRDRTLRRRSAGFSRHLNDLIETLAATGDAAAVGRFLDAILPHVGAWGGATASAPWTQVDRTIIKECLIQLNTCNAIAFPPGSAFLGYTRLECRTDLLDELMGLAVRMKYTGNTLSILRQYLRRILLARAGLSEVGDLTPEVVPDDPGKLRRTFFRLLCVAQRDKHGNAVIHNENSFAALSTLSAKKKSRDLQFLWATDDRPDMEDWRSAAADYLAQIETSSLITPRSAVGAFLQYVIDNPPVPRNPVAYLTRSIDGVRPYEFYQSNRENLRQVKLFLDWIIRTRLTSEDDEGRPVLLPGTVNPITERARSEARPTETVREAMPPKLMRRALEILTEDDWAFAKQRTSVRLGGDWFRWRNPETGDFEETWSPVRAIALYVKLRMPFRTIQVRMMDDGSADTLVCDRDAHRMVPNRGPLASGSREKPVLRGAVQAVQDRETGRTLLCCRLTTNKTADINKDAWNKGYLCPWLPDDVAEQLLFLAEWQRRYNPIAHPTPWRKLREFEHTKSDDVLFGMANCFLFRNPKNQYGRQDEPITGDDIMWLWAHLNHELERRLEAEGQLGLDGQPIRLVTAYHATTGQPTQTLYDLHALRVSIITSLLETGEASPEMMMKVVGHATVVMTMYYTKHSNLHISDCLHRADRKVLETEQENWVRHLRSLQYKDLRKAVVANSETGAQQFAHAASGNLLRTTIGICPVGGTQCHAGGAKMTKRVDEQVYGPVAGGRSNCAGCRFAITGEPFLHGIHVEFNARSFENVGLQRTRRKVEDHFEELEARRRQCAISGIPFPEYRDLDRVSDDLAEIDARLAQVATEMANLAALEAQIRRLVDERRRDGVEGLALVAGDFESVRIALEETTEIDLADRLCEAAVFYPSIAARGNLTELAAYFRGQRYDRVLRRERLDPRFMDMDSETSTYVGNRLMEFLELNIGRRATLRVLEGDASLTGECQRIGLLPEAFVAKFSDELDILLSEAHRMPGREPSQNLIIMEDRK